MTTVLALPTTTEQTAQETQEAMRAKVDALNQEAFKLCRTEPQKTCQLTQTARELAEAHNYLAGLAFGWRIEAIALFIKADHGQALLAAQTALTYYVRLADRKGEASVLGNFAIIYTELCDYKTALDCYLKTIAILEKEVEDPALLANTLGNLASVYMLMEQYPSALQRYEEALALLENSGATKLATTPLAFLLNGLANCYLKLEHYETAQAYLYRALTVTDKDDQYRQGSIFFTLGQTYRFLTQYAEGLAYLDKAMQIFEKVGDKRGVAGTILEMGKLQLAQGDFKQAHDFCQKAFELVNTANLRDWVYQVHEVLCQLYREQGDFKQALEHYEQYAKIKAEVSTNDNQKALMALQIRFELENAEKEREIFRLRNVELTTALEQLEVANQQIQTYAQALQRELKIGRQIQADFLPETLPQIAGWDLAASFQPAREVAGDFYDAFTLPCNLVGLVIADVCDKGVGAALFMSLIRSLVRILSSQAFARLQYFSSNFENYFVRVEEKAKTQTQSLMLPAYTYEVLNIIRTINDYIATNHSRTNMFATLFFGLLDTRNNIVSYVNAGHDAPIHATAQGIKARLPRTGPAVGVMAGVSYQIRQIHLEPGDTLLIYSDGVPEARNVAGTLFTEKYLLQLVEEQCQQANSEVTAESLLKIIKAAVQAHTGEAEPSDDITMLTIRHLIEDSHN